MTRWKLLIESGSSKTEWTVFNSQSVEYNCITSGYNLSQVEEVPEGFLVLELKKYFGRIEVVYFYGAGTSHSLAKERINDVIAPFEADEITIFSDMLAAARSLCKKSSGYVSILGTGTNSCYYDGDKLNYGVPSLGYVLGDMGSANHIGRRLIQDYFYGEMPVDIVTSFEQNFKLTKEKIITELYSSKEPAKYLGRYARFLSGIYNQWRVDFLKQIFIEFVSLYLVKNRAFGEHPYHFTGSIAYHYQDELKDVLSSFGYEMGNVVQAPSKGLIEFHQNYE